jgi:Domain of unknown function (DUF4340)
MNKSILAYATILVLSLGASWVQYTSEEAAVPKEGIVLADVKKDDLQQLSYSSPDLKVLLEIRKDDLGSYSWVTLTETKKKKGADGVETSEEVVTRFKGGEDATKLIEKWAPVMAMRELGRAEDKIESFGLKSPTSTVVVTTAGKTWTLELGGDTYGLKDRYVRDQGTGLVYVVDDQSIKPFTSKTKLRETAVFSAKKTEIESVKVGRGAATVTWEQKNIVDTAAAFWARQGGTGDKDETFSNWLDKLLKLRSQEYVQAEEPADLVPVMDLVIKPVDHPAESLQLLRSGEDWYARGSWVRGLVKLNKTATADVESEVDDVIEGKAPAAPATPEAPAAPGTTPEAPAAPGATPPAGGPPLSPPMPGAPPRLPALPKPPGQ